jgi:hypothetical protein
MKGASRMEKLYRCLYWRHNEFQLIQADFDNEFIRAEIARMEKAMSFLIERLGYMPQA